MTKQRVAVVTGGTRGIGAAISAALQKAGYSVAATYQTNDKEATKFTSQTGVAHFKFDVGDYKACEAGLKHIQADLGPVDVLVNNAGITRDAFLHKMKPEQWRQVIDTNLDSIFNMCRLVIEGMRTRGFGRIVNISSINGQTGQVGQTNYFRRQSRHYRLYQGAGAGIGGQGYHRQCHCAGLYRYGDGPFGRAGGAGEDRRPDPGRSSRQPGRHRPDGAVPRRRRRAFHDRGHVYG